MYFAKLSPFERSVLYTSDVGFIKVDWNLDDIGAHLNEDYWYGDDFMRSFTLLMASQKNNDNRTIFFDDDSNANQQIYNQIKQNCNTNHIYIIFFIRDNYAAGHWITLHIIKDQKFIHYYHTNQTLIPNQTIKEKILNICRNYLDESYDVHQNTVIFHSRSSNPSIGSWNVYQNTSVFSKENFNVDCGPVACVYLSRLTQSNRPCAQMLNQFEGSKKVCIESFLCLFTLLKTAHDMNLFSYGRSCRVQGSLVSDIELSQILVSQNQEFLQQQLVDFQHTCMSCIENFSIKINITNPCCHTRICFPCYIGYL